MIAYSKAKMLLQHALPALLCLQMSWAAPCAAESQNKIVWRVTDWAPVYIQNGPDQGTGLYDQMISALPDDGHASFEMSTPRTLQQMKNKRSGHAVCQVSMLKTSLTGYAHVSDVSSILPAHVIFVHRSVADDIRSLSASGDNYVPLMGLFMNDKFIGAHSSFRTRKATGVFRHSGTPPNVTLTAGNYRNLMARFPDGRVDIVHYPMIHEELTTTGADPNNIGIIEIAGTRHAPNFLVCAGCPKKRHRGQCAQSGAGAQTAHPTRRPVDWPDALAKGQIETPV